MESKNNIDKLFKDKLSNREFDIKESFLADLEGKLNAQKPKRKLWWIFYTLGIVIILGSLSYNYRTIEDTSSKYVCVCMYMYIHITATPIHTPTASKPTLGPNSDDASIKCI